MSRNAFSFVKSRSLVVRISARKTQSVQHVDRTEIAQSGRTLSRWKTEDGAWRRPELPLGGVRHILATTELDYSLYT